MCQRSQQSNGHTTVDDPNNRNDPCDRNRWNRIRFYSSDRNDRERSKRSYGHRPAIVNDQNDCHISQGSFHADFDFAPKNIRSWKFFERLERLNGHDSVIAQRSQRLTTSG